MIRSQQNFQTSGCSIVGIRGFEPAKEALDHKTVAFIAMKL